MNNKNLSIGAIINVFLILILISCHNRSLEKSSFAKTDKNNLDATHNKNFVDTILKTDVYIPTKSKADIINDKFANNPLGLDIETLKNGLDTFYFKNTFGLNPSFRIDTLRGPGDDYPYFICYDKDYVFKLRKLNNGKADPFGSVIIFNPKISIANGIRIGMNKSDFFKALNIEEINFDTIRIDSESHTSINFFIFKNKVLYEILLSNSL